MRVFTGELIYTRKAGEFKISAVPSLHETFNKETRNIKRTVGSAIARGGWHGRAVAVAVAMGMHNANVVVGKGTVDPVLN